MTKIHEVKVLCNKEGRFGEPHALIIDEVNGIDPEERQAIATRLGLDETVFINNVSAGDISIFDTSKEVPFAGTAALAAAWFMRTLQDKPLDKLVCRGKEIPVKFEANLLWITASLDVMPGWNHVQFDSPDLVDAITLEDAKSFKHTMVWAWIDEKEGKVRARTLASDWDIPEVEANGSGSMMLAAAVGKSIEILHGEGSIIMAKPLPNDRVTLGGRALEVKTTTL